MSDVPVGSFGNRKERAKASRLEAGCGGGANTIFGGWFTNALSVILCGDGSADGTRARCKRHDRSLGGGRAVGKMRPECRKQAAGA